MAERDEEELTWQYVVEVCGEPDGGFTATSQELGISAWGDSEDDALNALSKKIAGLLPEPHAAAG